MSTPCNWVQANIRNLSAVQFHNLMKLRVDVFVVEQACVYPELDGQDALESTQHIFAVVPSGDVIAAARVLASGDTKPARIGRVVVTPSYRGAGLSRELMDRVMTYCQTQYPNDPIALSAQVGADGLYKEYGFTVVSEDYLDDGIPHRDMRFTPS